MRLIIFGAILFSTIFYFLPSSEIPVTSSVSKSEVSPAVKPETTTEVSIKLDASEVTTETDPLKDTFWEEVRERWNIDFRELITRLEPEKAEEILSRYENAKTAYGIKVTRIINLQANEKIPKKEISRMFKIVDEDYEVTLKDIFGIHYDEINASLSKFQEEIQGLNNDGDYAIGMTL